jgi:putative hemolysin
VTLEDLLEELVGEVSDPFDAVHPDFQKQPDGSVLIDGLTLIDDVNQQLGLELSDADYDTIAGFVLGKLGRIPSEDEIVEAQGVRLVVEKMDGMRIAWLSLQRIVNEQPGLPAQKPTKNVSDDISQKSD